MKRYAAGFAALMLLLATKESVSSPPEEPRLVGEGSISTPDDETGFALSPDGRTAFIAKNSPTTTGIPIQVICVAHWVNDRWGSPEIAPFSGKYRDFGPALSPDGNRLFFTSDRPVGGSEKPNLNIWFVQRTGNGWGEPQELHSVNSPATEYGASVAANGNLYFASSREGGKGSFDIYRSEFKDGEYREPRNLGESVNTAGPEIEPAISPDESTLVFTALGRDDELVGVHREYNKGDLYVSFQREGVWTPARNVGAPINSGAEESWPRFSADGRALFFSSERGFASYRLPKRVNWRQLRSGLEGVRNGMGNIYQADAKALSNR